MSPGKDFLLVGLVAPKPGVFPDVPGGLPFLKEQKDQIIFLFFFFSFSYHQFISAIF